MRTRSALHLAVLSAASVLLASQSSYGKEQITVTRKDGHQHPSKADTCEIAVFQEPGTKPEAPHIEVAIINFHDEKHRSKDGSLKLYVVLPLLKTRACRLGADALVDIRVTEVRRLEYVMYNVRATAVRFEPETQHAPGGESARP
jgi:hypothetical protein